MRRKNSTTLITHAAVPRPEEIHRRQRRYVLSMLFRTVCLLLAVLALHGWLRFAAIAVAVVTPWLAVVFANGGPPIPRDNPSLYVPAHCAAEEPPALQAAHHEVVDAESWEVGREATAQARTGAEQTVPRPPR